MIMISRRTIQTALLGIIALTAMSLELYADVPFTIMAPQPERTLDTSGFTTYEIHVTNTTGDSIGVRATRLVVDVPDTSWHTSICSITTCYPEEVSVTPAEPLAANGETGFTLHVISGRTYGQTG